MHQDESIKKMYALEKKSTGMKNRARRVRPQVRTVGTSAGVKSNCINGLMNSSEINTNK